MKIWQLFPLLQIFKLKIREKINSTLNFKYLRVEVLNNSFQTKKTT